MSKDIPRQVAVILAVLATIIVNGLANALPINGQTTGEISDRFQVYFVPAGYVFSIWGLIYLGLVAYAFYQALPSRAQNPRLRAVAPFFLLSSGANILWILLWHYEFFLLTLLAMVSLLVLLIAIYRTLDVRGSRVASAERWLVHLPFSIYLGWITVATIANVTAVLAYYNWDGWGISPEAWTVIMLVVGTAIALATSLPRRDAAFMGVIVWAFAGIAIKHAGTPVVSTSAWIMAALVALIAGAILVLSFRKGNQLAPSA